MLLAFVKAFANMFHMLLTFVKLVANLSQTLCLSVSASDQHLAQSHLPDSSVGTLYPFQVAALQFMHVGVV